MLDNLTSSDVRGFYVYNPDGPLVLDLPSEGNGKVCVETVEQHTVGVIRLKQPHDDVHEFSFYHMRVTDEVMRLLKEKYADISYIEWGAASVVIQYSRAKKNGININDEVKSYTEENKNRLLSFCRDCGFYDDLEKSIKASSAPCKNKKVNSVLPFGWELNGRQKLSPRAPYKKTTQPTPV